MGLLGKPQRLRAVTQHDADVAGVDAHRRGSGGIHRLDPICLAHQQRAGGLWSDVHRLHTGAQVGDVSAQAWLDGGGRHLVQERERSLGVSRGVEVARGLHDAPQPLCARRRDPGSLGERAGGGHRGRSRSRLATRTLETRGGRFVGPHGRGGEVPGRLARRVAGEDVAERTMRGAALGRRSAVVGGRAHQGVAEAQGAVTEGHDPGRLDGLQLVLGQPEGP